LIIAGHDTTASTVAWILWELAHDQDSQARFRDEIKKMKASKAEKTPFSSADYDSMAFLNAIIKEGLRLHPIVPNLLRQASRDDIIPLSEPITTNDGHLIREIPVTKGQTLMCSLAVYNRFVAVIIMKSRRSNFAACRLYGEKMQTYGDPHASLEGENIVSTSVLWEIS
jgi:cytochrome P450